MMPINPNGTVKIQTVTITAVPAIHSSSYKEGDVDLYAGAPMGFVVAIMNSVAEATMDFMAQDPTNAKKHCKAGFDAVWRMIA